jgi:5-methyltetrahydrofolate--homocysteine methyltransferase
MHAVAPEVVLVAKANAGLPTLVQGRAVYGATPEVMGDYARAAAGLGARIIGGCCGTTPAHLRAMANALDGRLV